MQAKLHPTALNNSVLDNMLHKTSAKTLLSFLSKELDCVDRKKAEELIEAFGPDFDEQMDPATLDQSKIRKMVDKIQQQEFDKPSGAALSPAGEYNLHLGIMKEMRPNMIATNTADVQEVDGHPLVVEAAVSLGGRRAKEGITVHRFANRIPMLFQPGSDVSFKTANNRIQWKAYRIDKNTQKIGVYVSIVSTRIPYGGAHKEFIGDENEDLQKCVRDAIMKCCIQLKVCLSASLSLSAAPALSTAPALFDLGECTHAGETASGRGAEANERPAREPQEVHSACRPLSPGCVSVSQCRLCASVPQCLSVSVSQCLSVSEQIVCFSVSVFLFFVSVVCLSSLMPIS